MDYLTDDVPDSTSCHSDQHVQVGIEMTVEYHRCLPKSIQFFLEYPVSFASRDRWRMYIHLLFFWQIRVEEGAFDVMLTKFEFVVYAECEQRTVVVLRLRRRQVGENVLVKSMSYLCALPFTVRRDLYLVTSPFAPHFTLYTHRHRSVTSPLGNSSTNI